MKPLVRAAALTAICLGASLPAGAADFIITPFVGKTFAAQATFPLTATVDKQTWIVGGSAAWLTPSILGAEVDFGYAPRFFKSDQFLLPSGSNIVSLTGSVILTVPLSLTRESLRPYLTAGMGLLHASADDAAGLSTVDSNRLGYSLGGGAIGFLTPRAGVRFDLRRIRSSGKELNNATLLNEPQLSFWRATIGVALRY